MNLMEALSITVSSMAIVFLTLLLISFVLESFKIIFKEKPSTKDNNEANDEVSLTRDVDTIDEEEKVVVALAASIMAGEGKVNPNLHVKKISRIK